MLAIIAALKSMQPQPQYPLTVLQQAKDLFAPASEPERDRNEIARLDQILGFAQKLAASRTPNGGSRSAALTENRYPDAQDVAELAPIKA